MRAIKSVFEGRMPRGHFWFGVVGITLTQIGLYWGLGIPEISGPVTSRGMTANVVVDMASLLPVAIITIRRLHDLDKPSLPLAAAMLITYAAASAGSWFDVFDSGRSIPMIAVGLVIAFNLGLVVYLGVVRGTAGPNRYGPDPKAPALPPVVA